MSVKYKPGDSEQPHFITFAVVQWIDLLTRSRYKDIIVESLKFCIENKGLNLHAWVIMSNHVHLILSAKKDFHISHILRDFKKFTSKQIYQSITENPNESRKDWLLYMLERAGKRNSNNKNFQVWRQDNHPIELINIKMLSERMEYLHYNPVEAVIVFNPEDYVYSSGIDYYTKRKGKILIDRLSF